VPTMPKGTRSRIPELLRANGWDATEFARRADIAYGLARRLKAGETGPFTTTTLEKAAAALGEEYWPDLFEPREVEVPSG